MLHCGRSLCGLHVKDKRFLDVKCKSLCFCLLPSGIPLKTTLNHLFWVVGEYHNARIITVNPMKHSLLSCIFEYIFLGGELEEFHSKGSISYWRDKSKTACNGEPMKFVGFPIIPKLFWWEFEVFHKQPWYQPIGPCILMISLPQSLCQPCFT